MKLSVEHSTVYRYDNAVSLQPHTFRLRPRMNSTQRLIAFEIQILPAPAGTIESLDQDGNLVLNAWFDTLTEQLSVVTRFTVELLRDNPFDFLLSGESSNLPLRYLEPLSTALAPYKSALLVGESVKQYADSLVASSKWNTLTFLTVLNRQIFQTFNHVIRPEGQPWPSDLTLTRREGSCRDLAVLFCDACRVMGIAARFVSGYECASADCRDSYMHAWAEVYLPGAGWRGYDPSRGLAVANAHVAVAAGFEPSLASPIAGLFCGDPRAKLDASLSMHIELDPVV